jgi:hypothetical protein
MLHNVFIVKSEILLQINTDVRFGKMCTFSGNVFHKVQNN